jgi:hypothetical protein
LDPILAAEGNALFAGTSIFVGLSSSYATLAVLGTNLM